MSALPVDFGAGHSSSWSCNGTEVQFADQRASTAEGGWLTGTMMQSQLLGAGFLLMLLNFALIQIRNCLFYTGQFLVSFIITSVQVDDSDRSYKWMEEWMSDQHSNENNVILKANFSTELTGKNYWPNESLAKFIPALGVDFLWYEGSLMFCHRSVRKPATMFGCEKNVLVLAMLRWNKSILRDLVEKCRLRYHMADRAKVVCYNVDDCLSWSRFTARNRRPLESVYLDEQVKTEIVHDATRFLQSQQWYKSRGIPHRRGFLLWGPPGTGKSSLIISLAGELQCAICTLSLDNQKIGDSALAALLNSAPPRSIILLEDVDNVFRQREKQSGVEAKITFSGLLNALDGAFSQEGRMIFMTTNAIEDLDEALIRPGRIDKRIRFRLCDKQQATRMFTRFFGNHPLDSDAERAETGCGSMDEEELSALAKQFGNALPSNVISPAAVQTHLLEHRSNPRAAIINIPNLITHELEEQRKQKEEAAEKRRGIEEMGKQKEEKKVDETV